MDLNSSVASYHEIHTGLWLGNEAASQDKKLMMTMDIIINATKHIPFAENIAQTKVCVRVPVNDPGPSLIMNEDNTIMLSYLPDVCNLIKKNRTLGKRVFVHCHAGAQRAAAIVVAYLVRHGVWDIHPSVKVDTVALKFDSAVKLVITKRPIAFFGGRSINFLPALVNFL